MSSFSASRIVVSFAVLAAAMAMSMWFASIPPSTAPAAAAAPRNSVWWSTSLEAGASAPSGLDSEAQVDGACRGGVEARNGSILENPPVHFSQRRFLEGVLEEHTRRGGRDAVRHAHIHVITFGDSTAFGVSARNLKHPKPFTPVLAEVLSRRFQSDLRQFSKEGGSTRSAGGAFWSDDVRVSHSSEVHAFPGFSSKKAVFAMKKLETYDLSSFLARQKEKQKHRLAANRSSSGVASAVVEEEVENWFAFDAPQQHRSVAEEQAGGSTGGGSSVVEGGAENNPSAVSASSAAEGSAHQNQQLDSEEAEVLERDLALEEETEERMGGNKFDAGVGLRVGGSPGGAASKKGGAQGYSRYMVQSEQDDDKDLVELSYESFFRRFAQRTVDARRLNLGLGNFTKEESTTFVTSSKEKKKKKKHVVQVPPLIGNHSGAIAAEDEVGKPNHNDDDDDDPDMLVVVCNVLAGINDAMMGIPWWWTRSNLHRLHDMCRSKVHTYLRTMITSSSAAGCSRSTGDVVPPPPRPPKVTIVVSVPLRMIPPFYFIQEGMTAQTHRRAKRVLDPMGQCEFYFRSPRRKLNLYHMMDIMPWVGLSSHRTYRHSRLLESYEDSIPAPPLAQSGGENTTEIQRQRPERSGLLLWNPTALSSRWCRRPVACRGLPLAKDLSGTRDAKLFASPSTMPCFTIGASSSPATTLCFLTRRMIPVDKHFVFPDKLSSSALWRLALSKWDDCLHPSIYGYFSLADTLAGKLSRDLMKTVFIMMRSPPPVTNAAPQSTGTDEGSSNADFGRGGASGGKDDSQGGGEPRTDSELHPQEIS